MKINAKSFVFGFIILLVIAVFVGSASAITGTIGNGRMILRVNAGDEIQKYVKVVNNNDVDVNIVVYASGDLVKDIVVIDKNFTLKAGEEKNAYFTISVKEAGTTESKINVQFSPVEKGSGVGLSSTVIVIAGGDGVVDDVDDKIVDDDLADNDSGKVVDNEEDNSETDNSETDDNGSNKYLFEWMNNNEEENKNNMGITSITSAVIGNKDYSLGIVPAILITSFTLLILAAVLVLHYFYNKRMKTKPKKSRKK